MENFSSALDFSNILKHRRKFIWLREVRGFFIKLFLRTKLAIFKISENQGGTGVVLETGNKNFYLIEIRSSAQLKQ